MANQSNGGISTPVKGGWGGWGGLGGGEVGEVGEKGLVAGWFTSCKTPEAVHHII